jgi:hypothetical protein
MIQIFQQNLNFLFKVISFYFGKKENLKLLVGINFHQFDFQIKIIFFHLFILISYFIIYFNN